VNALTVDVGFGYDRIARKFTGKERDVETGNDYFGARYFSSPQGRWTIPDWSGRQEPVPYAKLDNPQSLNLYAYVLNNPLSRMDADGHIDCSGKNAQGIGCQFIAAWSAAHGIAQGLTGTAAQLLNDGVRRIQYFSEAAGLGGPGSSAARKSLQAATYRKLSPIGQAYTDAASAARKAQLVGKTAEQLLESAPRTNPSINAAGVGSAVVGTAGVALGVGSVVVDTLNAPAGQRIETATQGGMALGASLAGAQAGAEVGAFAGPWGAFVGSVVGGLGGAQAVKAVKDNPLPDGLVDFGRYGSAFM
jgi:RHS repeat-associated protein